MTFSATPRTLISISVVFLVVAAVFGVLNTTKIKTLRSSAADAIATRDATDRRRAVQEKEIKAREAAIAAEKAKVSESKGKMANAEGELVKVQTEKADLQAKLQANETEIANLQKQIDEAKPASANPGAPSKMELQAQLDDARRQLDSAGRDHPVVCCQS